MLYCQHQQNPVARKQCEYCLKEGVLSDLYDEIKRMEPAFRNLCAAKTTRKNTEGMAQLRQGAPSASTAGSAIEPSQLGRYAKELYEWLDPSKRSAIRLCMQWQVLSNR